MKIIVTTVSPNIDAALDPRFGRGAYFIIVDSETMNWRAVPNPSMSSSAGAGFQAAQYVAMERADVVISGQFGVNAVNALKETGAILYQYSDCQTGREAIERWKSGQLQAV